MKNTPESEILQSFKQRKGRAEFGKIEGGKAERKVVRGRVETQQAKVHGNAEALNTSSNVFHGYTKTLIALLFV